MARPRIVIIGGGFAGVKCAQTLCRRPGADVVEVVLFSQENHMVFHPLLAEVVGSSLDPQAIVSPLRQMLPQVECRSETVQEIDLSQKSLVYQGHDGLSRRLSYDHLVIACGRVANLGSVPGMADYSLPMKTVGDAVKLRAQVIEQMEKAEVCEVVERRRWYLSFVIVGGGFSGIEAAGEINDFVRGSRRFYHNIPEQDISVTVVHSGQEILPEIDPALRGFARQQMTQAAIQIMLECRVAQATPEGVQLQDGRIVRGATVVCTAGTTVAPVVQNLKAPKTKDRLTTDPDMRISGVPSAWALGDCALVMNAYDGKPCPPTGQFAERQGRQAAQNLARVLAGEPTRPFYFKPLGQLCSIGGHRAVADLFGHHIAGFWAWFIWRGVYLLKLPSWPRRFRVGFDWAWQLMFARDLSGLRPDFTDRVSRAHYQPGEFVFHQGDPATNFYVIDRGDVEVVRTNPDTGADEVLALLGAGSFFGELALFSNRPRNAGIRARSAVDVIVMGREVFTQISQSLAPLREILSQTINRRTTDLWHQRTAAYQILKEVPLTDFVEPVPFPLLRPEDTFAHAVELFDQKAYEFCYVSPDGQTLAGVVTRTDLFRALSSGAKPETSVGEFMTKDPVAICLADTSLAAAATMRDHHLKWLPVVNAMEDRHLVGCLRAHAMLARVTKEISNQTAPSG